MGIEEEVQVQEKALGTWSRLLVIQVYTVSENGAVTINFFSLSFSAIADELVFDRAGPI